MVRKLSRSSGARRARVGCATSPTAVAVRMEIVVRGRNVVIPDHYRHTRRREARQARAVRPQDHPDRRRAAARAQPAPERQLPARRDHLPHPRPGRAQRGLCRGLLQGARPGRRAARAPLPAGGRPAPGAPRPAHPAVGARRSPATRPSSSRRGGTGDRPTTTSPRTVPGGSCARRSTRRADDRRRGAVRDGAGRPRLLPVPATRTPGGPSVVYRRHAYDYGLIRLGG